jgi:hypothetical protein
MKNKKILSVILLVVVITTLFVPMFSISTYAADDSVDDTVDDTELIYYILNGDFFVFDSPLPSAWIGIDPTFFPTAQFYIRFRVLTTEQIYTGIKLVYVDDVSVNNNDQVNVYFVDENNNENLVYGGLSGGWDNEGYRMIEFLADSSDAMLSNWLNTNGKFYKSLFQDGYNQGYEVGKIEGYNLGYNTGVSSGFGNNLIGETLAAPVRALDSFVLYETSSGFSITLWGVFSTVLAVALTIWFIKMFAGG